LSTDFKPGKLVSKIAVLFGFITSMRNRAFFRGQRRAIASIVCMLMLLGAVLFPNAAPAQEPRTFPTHRVRVIVPFAAGGPTDVMARLIADKLSQSTGVTFTVENHPGAGGNIGMGLVKQAPADGHTIWVVSSSFVVNPSLSANPTYDVYGDFAPVTLAATTPSLLVAHPSLGVGTVKDLAKYLKAHRDKGSVASPGTGTTAHLAAETFRRALDLDLVHVPFGGAAPALNATLGGHVSLAFVGLSLAAHHVKKGTLIALATTGETRAATLPDVPTMAEAGVPGDQVSDIMQAVLVRGGTPPAVVETIYRHIAKALAEPDVKQKLEALGFDVVASTPAQFAERIRREVPKWAKVITDAQIKSE
jgi:tripartite-type tricarboxylate transporter receptor subunit TctC